MIWAEIKSAINSTLGTKNFKPLDKIVEDALSKDVYDGSITITGKLTIEINGQQYSANFGDTWISSGIASIDFESGRDFYCAPEDGIVRDIVNSDKVYRKVFSEFGETIGYLIQHGNDELVHNGSYVTSPNDLGAGY